MRTASAAASAGPSVDVFRAVADPTRRTILDRLRSDELSVTDLAGPFDMTQPAVSQHLRILLDAGLVEAEQIGRQRVYKLNAQPLHEVFEWSGQYRHLFIDPVGHAWRITTRSRAPRKRTRKAPRGPTPK